jgi:hypothetical protein
MSGFFYACWLAPERGHGTVCQADAHECLACAKNGDVIVNFRVLSNAAILQVTRLYAGRRRASICLKLQARPVDGKANQSLYKWLVPCLGVTQGVVALMRGTASQLKQLKVNGPAIGDWIALLACAIVPWNTAKALRI